jgi:hypothetical protein
VVSEAGVLVTRLLRAFTALSDGCLRDTTNDDAGNVDDRSKTTFGCL